MILTIIAVLLGLVYLVVATRIVICFVHETKDAISYRRLKPTEIGKAILVTVGWPVVGIILVWEETSW